MRKLFILLTLYLFITVTPALAEQIQKFESTITINQNGSIDVLEQIDYDFGLADRHGIYRNIPFIKENQEGKKFVLDFDNWQVSDAEGNQYPFQSSTQNHDQWQLKIGDADITITGQHQYNIEYQVIGAITYYSDHDELFWNITGNDWPVGINQAQTKITLPKELSDEQIKATCYTGSYGVKEQDCEITQDKNTVLVTATRPLNSSEGLSVVVGFPKELVAFVPAKEYISFWQTLWGKLIKVSLIILVTLWYLVYPILIIVKWWRFGRDPKASEARAWFSPPKSTNKKDLRPAEVGVLIDETAHTRDLLGTMIDLAQRGYMRIEEKKKDHVSLIRTKEYKSDQDLLIYEKELLEGIFSEKKKVDLKDTKLYTTVNKVNKQLYELVVKEGYFPKNPNKIRLYYSGISVAALFTLNFFLLVVALTFGLKMPRKTKIGAQKAAESRALRSFIKTQERQLEFQAKHKYLFEKLLGYAIVFGVEKVWAKRFKHLNLTPPDWYQGYDQRNFNSALLVNNLNHSLRSVQAAATPPSSTRSSSGFSSGFSSGGFSGGGGGGGGGGSW